MKKTSPGAVTCRCAIYTRKSTTEGPEQAFTSLDAQRESAEAYIASQRHQGWVRIAQRYDDGGCTGGNLERPALQRLLADLQAGHIDVVVVNKVDRLSRSLLDFARLMETFEKHQVAFVAVTQQFNSATSMGRLVLNVLLSFAQFERELIAERTRDKIAAARRKGRWAGGHPLLGYDVDPRGATLSINDAEAVRVRAIFALYLEYQSLSAVVEELFRRRWFRKQWRTRSGQSRGGGPFTKNTLHQLLTNVIYRGQIRYRNEVHDGAQPGIVPAEVWQQAQALLQAQGPAKEDGGRSNSGALVGGLLHCVSCGCALTPSHCTKGNKRYRYYVCVQAQKLGWQRCPAPSISAPEIERFVVEQIHELVGIATDCGTEAGAADALSSTTEHRALARLLALLDWQSLSHPTQARLVRALIRRIDFYGAHNKMSLDFHAADHPALSAEIASLTNQEAL